MNKYKIKYKKITGKLVRRSFPSLVGKKIFFIERDLGQFSAMVLWLFPFLRVMLINPTVRGRTNKQTIGLFAHELCHFELFLADSWFKTMIGTFWYALSEKRKIEDERETDMLTIRKGYARELYESVVEGSKNKSEKVLNRYFSPAEIKGYANRIGKW
ncbi:MAG: hypothetical protein ABIG28_00150 [archaeon]